MRNWWPQFRPGMLLGAALLIGFCPVHGQDAKGIDKAKKALIQFGIQVAANDLDGTLKTVDVPFYHNANDPKKGEVVRERAELKKLSDRRARGARGA